jgi:hypothetical protein
MHRKKKKMPQYTHSFHFPRIHLGLKQKKTFYHFCENGRRHFRFNTKFRLAKMKTIQ